MGFYVYKNGRCLTECDSYEEADRRVEEIGGDVVADIVSEVNNPPTVIEMLNNMCTTGWKPCTEETYPVDGDNDCVIVAYWGGEQWQYWTYENCPYGWNVLCRSKAYWMQIKKPYRDE